MFLVSGVPSFPEKELEKRYNEAIKYNYLPDDEVINSKHAAHVLFL
jgi:hypothetical protein